MRPLLKLILPWSLMLKILPNPKLPKACSAASTTQASPIAHSAVQITDLSKSTGEASSTVVSVVTLRACGEQVSDG